MTEQEPDLQDLFPNLKPISSPPTLFTLNGFGFSMYGKRDFDPQTNTYIKTHCICALFIPIFTLGAYRVADAQGSGWHFIGKEKKSTLAKIWNRLIVSILIYFAVTTAWTMYTTTPAYLSEKNLAAANELVEEGEHFEAAKLYQTHIRSKWPLKDEATIGLNATCSELLQSNSAKEVVKAIRILKSVPVSYRSDIAIYDQLPNLGLAAVNRFRLDSPKDAITILNACKGLKEGQAERDALRLTLLEEAVKVDPRDHQSATALALIYEQSEQFDKAFSLLEPIEDLLGDTEGARLYGQLLQVQGRFTEASPHLERYVTARTKVWKKAEANISRVYEQSYNRVIEDLNNNRAPSSFYRSYEAASPQEQNRMVDEYANEKIHKDPSYKLALNKYSTAAEIVPVVMELGIAQLRAGQASTDPAEKQELLEKAETTLVSLQGAAGETDEYRLFLGQVYYWTGRQAAGRKLFDDLLQANQRNYQSLISLSVILREVGDVNQAQELANEAYQATSNKEEKYHAASLCAVLARETEDQITWLKRTDPNAVSYNIRLADAKAQQASENGEVTKAIRYFREASKGWSQLPESATTLNNNALVHQQLYRLTGDPEEQAIAAEMLDQALRYVPNDSILISNTLNALLISAALEVIDDSVTSDFIQVTSAFTAMNLLYHDQAELDAFTQRLIQTQSWQRSLELLQDWIILAPNSTEAYSIGIFMYSLADDEQGFETLLERINQATIDQTQSREESEAYWKGESSEKYKKTMELGIARTEELSSKIADAKSKTLANLVLELAKTGRSTFGQKVDHSSALTTAIQAKKQYPSKFTSQALVAIQMDACISELQKSDTELSAYIQQYRPFIESEELLSLILDHPQFGPIAKASPVVAYTIQGYSAYHKDYPRHYNSHKWSLIRHFASNEEIESIAQLAKSNVVSSLSLQLQEKITPYSTSQVIRNYYNSILLGDTIIARRTYDQARSSGMPLPALQ